MRAQRGLLRLALSFAGLLASLSLVIWRQSRALEMLRGLDQVRQERAVLETERSLLLGRIQRLESRGQVVAAAGARLGMRVPVGDEIVVLPYGPVAGGTSAGGATAGDASGGVASGGVASGGVATGGATGGAVSAGGVSGSGATGSGGVRP